MTSFLASRFVKVFTEYLTTALAANDGLTIQKLGRFSVVKGKKQLRITFASSEHLRSLVRGSNSRSEHPYAKRIKLRLTKTFQTPREKHSLYASLKQLDSLALTNKAKVGGLLRLSLMKYLRTSLPYEGEWVHPISRQSYSAEYMLAKLDVFRELNPESFKILRIMWLGHESKVQNAKKLGISASTLINRWYVAADYLVALVVFESTLEEHLIKSFING